MITDYLKYSPAYFNLSPGIRTALEFLQQADLGALEPGRHAVEGDRVFAQVSDYDTRDVSETFWEAHQQHVDVQFVQAGRERIGYASLAECGAAAYDPESDLAVVTGVRGEQQVEVGPGRFVVLFPHDVHMPGLHAGSVARVRKVVLKVRLD